MKIDIKVPAGWTENEVLRTVRQFTGFEVKQSTTMYTDVQDFATEFRVPIPEQPSMLNEENLSYRSKFLLEELEEFMLDHIQGNGHGCLDAMIDLCYVAIGTAQMMGVTQEQWETAWAEVQRANMSKVLTSSAADSKRGSAIDVIKPAGWVGPDYSFMPALPWPTR